MAGLCQKRRQKWPSRKSAKSGLQMEAATCPQKGEQSTCTRGRWTAPPPLPALSFDIPPVCSLPTHGTALHSRKSTVKSSSRRPNSAIKPTRPSPGTNRCNQESLWLLKAFASGCFYYEAPIPLTATKGRDELKHLSFPCTCQSQLETVVPLRFCCTGGFRWFLTPSQARETANFLCGSCPFVWGPTK